MQVALDLAIGSSIDAHILRREDRPGFIEQTDLVSGLASATNLIELNPFEFQQPVAHLFGQM
ncbi:MAG: hypothetical protein ACREDP_22000, partial [Bradyrhizobium sp.]